MDAQTLRALLESLARGDSSVAEALARIGAPAAEEIAGSTIDHDRAARCGYPEVVLCEGKREEDAIVLAARILEVSGRVLLTRAGPELLDALARRFPDGRADAEARTFHVDGDAKEPEGLVIVVSAGTSDGPVAAEATVTARALGARVERIDDVGVAGVHRLLAHTERLVAAHAIVVVAGMEGALPSVVAGLVDRPVIGVPTSVGYGVAFGGVAALLGMLTGCASGVLVVNIDNGFGAGYAAATINRAVVGASR